MKHLSSLVLLAMAFSPYACSQDPGAKLDTNRDVAVNLSSDSKPESTDDRSSGSSHSGSIEDNHSRHTHGQVILINGEQSYLEARIRGFLKIELRNLQGLGIPLLDLKARITRGSDILSDRLIISRDDSNASEWRISGFDFSQARMDKDITVELILVTKGSETALILPLAQIRAD